MLDFADTVGLLGVTLSTYVYGRVQWHRDYAKSLSYSLINLAASMLFFYSLSKHWNMASFISNMAWALISLYGVYRCLKYERIKKRPTSS